MGWPNKENMIYSENFHKITISRIDDLKELYIVYKIKFIV